MQEKQLTSSQVQGFAPSGLAEVEKFAEMLFESRACGADCTTRAHIIAKIIAGLEMGMLPMEATQSLYIVNGKITIYGMAMTKKIKEAGYEIEILKHDQQECSVKVSKGAKSYTQSITLAELTKMFPASQALKKAPKDKLFWHCISRIIRYHLPELIGGGGVKYIYEEFEGEPEEKPTVVEVTEKKSPITNPEEVPKIYTAEPVKSSSLLY